jgi:hypothetical protein
MKKRFRRLPLLYRLTLLLLCILMTGGVAARLSGERVPLSFQALFTNPDGTSCNRPCLFGIRPGETTVDQAIWMIKLHPATRDLPIVTDQNANQHLMVVVGDATMGKMLHFSVDDTQKDNVVSSIELMNWPLRSLGEVMSVLGYPDFIQVWDEQYTDSMAPNSWSYYLNDRIMISSFRERGSFLGIDDPVINIAVTSRPIHIVPGMIPWLGFTNILRRFGKTE